MMAMLRELTYHKKDPKDRTEECNGPGKNPEKDEP